MELGGAGQGKGQCPQLPWPAGGWGGGLDSAIKVGPEVGGRAAAGETERQRAPAQTQKDRAEGEMVWRQRQPGSLQERRNR